MIFPTIVMRLFRRVATSAIQVSWPAALGLSLAHALSTAAGFQLMGESDLVASPVQFLYFYVVTGSSVGYGDFSPATEAGKLFAALYVIPGAISIFAFMLGKIVATVSIRMRKTMNGLADFSTLTDHIVVLGHVPGQTENLLAETRRVHGHRDVVIVSATDLSGMQDKWHYVRASSLSTEADLLRAGVQSAAFIVILASTDEESLTASLAIARIAPVAHCVAYFRDRSSASLVEAHCPGIETVTSTSVEQMARALTDPGASDLLRRLVSSEIGATLHSARLKNATTVGQLMQELLAAYGATLLGYRPGPRAEPVMSLRPDQVLAAGQTVYYVGEHRLPDELDDAT